MRKVTRVVRHVDPWSVFKIAIIANIVLYLIVLTAGVLLWNVAYATGTVDNVERFFESFGWQTFEFNGGEIYHSAWIAGLFAVLGLTGLAVLARHVVQPDHRSRRWCPIHGARRGSRRVAARHRCGASSFDGPNPRFRPSSPMRRGRSSAKQSSTTRAACPAERSSRGRLTGG